MAFYHQFEAIDPPVELISSEAAISGLRLLERLAVLELVKQDFEAIVVYLDGWWKCGFTHCLKCCCSLTASIWRCCTLRSPAGRNVRIIRLLIVCHRDRNGCSVIVVKMRG